MKKFEETGLSTVFIPCWSLTSLHLFFLVGKESSILWFYLWVIQVTNNFVVGSSDRLSISSYPMWYQWYHQYSTSYPIMWYSTSWFKFNPNVTKTGSHVSSRWTECDVGILRLEYRNTGILRRAWLISRKRVIPAGSKKANTVRSSLFYWWLDGSITIISSLTSSSIA